MNYTSRILLALYELKGGTTDEVALYLTDGPQYKSRIGANLDGTYRKAGNSLAQMRSKGLVTGSEGEWNLTNEGINYVTQTLLE